MSSFGVTPEGFGQKTVEDIKAEIEAAERASFGPAINLLSTSVFGQINGVFADRLAELWEVSAAIYRSIYPDSASGEALDNVASLTGVIRLGPQTSSVSVIATGTVGTILNTGRILSVIGTGDRFSSTASATLALATARATGTPYVLHGIRSNSGNIYAVTIPGTSGGGAGPSGTGTAIVDGTVTWRFIGTGLSFASVPFVSEQLDAINAVAFSLTQIQTPVAGWNGAGNLLDADLGRLVETDPDFRLRREQLLRQTGAGTVEAIRARVRALDGVTETIVFENTSLVTDVNGLPGKSFEVVARGGDSQTIADTIWFFKPAGIETYGTLPPFTVADSQGINHTIKFSRPTALDMYVNVTVVTNPSTFPVDGVTQVKAALVALGDTLTIGQDVIMLRFRCTPLETVSGVTDVTVLQIDTIPSPVNTANIIIPDRSLAVFDTSRINVTVL